MKLNDLTSFVKIILIFVLVAFTYRLLWNISCLIRSNYYLKYGFDEENIKNEECKIAIRKILIDANMFTSGEDKNSLRTARGIFKMYIKENFSPFFWIRSVFYAPVSIFKSSGNKRSKALNTFISILWWLFCFAVDLFQDEIKNFFLAFFNFIKSY